MDTVALVIGWIVIVAAGAAGVCAAWWCIGDLIWSKVLPSDWKKAQFTLVPDAKPRLSRAGVILLFVLGGPVGWLRAPRVIAAQREKAERLNPDRDSAATGPSGAFL